MKPLNIKAKGELKPKVEPIYKYESFPWFKVAGILSMLGSVTLTVLSAIAGQEFMVLLGVVLSAITSGFTNMLKGDYALAVKLVNSIDVKEWSYNSGIAIIMLSDETLVVLDTRLKKMYLSREFSAQCYPLRVGVAKPNVKLTAFVKPKLIDLKASREIKRARILRGIAEVPSIKSEKEFMRLFGTFLEVNLRGSKCFKETSLCVEKLIKMLKEA